MIASPQNIDASRERQLSFYDEECDPEFEISRPHSCGRLYEFLIEHKFRTGLRVLGFELAGRSVLEVCCGSGMMAEKFAQAGAAVTGIDFSPQRSRGRESVRDAADLPRGFWSPMRRVSLLPTTASMWSRSTTDSITWSTRSARSAKWRGSRAMGC